MLDAGCISHRKLSHFVDSRGTLPISRDSKGSNSGSCCAHDDRVVDLSSGQREPLCAARHMAKLYPEKRREGSGRREGRGAEKFVFLFFVLFLLLVKALLCCVSGRTVAGDRRGLGLTPFFLITWTFHPSMALAMAVTMRASANMIRRSPRKICEVLSCQAAAVSLLKTYQSQLAELRTEDSQLVLARRRFSVALGSNSRRGRLVPQVLPVCLLQQNTGCSAGS